MSWLALEPGDAATWGGTVVTFGMACYAIVQGAGQRRDMRRQNELQAEVSQLQRRQIETAERRTLVMEQILDRLTAASEPVQSARPPVAAAPPPPGPSSPTPPWLTGSVPVPQRNAPPVPSETRDEDEEPDEPGESEPPGEDQRPAGPDGGEHAVPAAARSRVPAKPKRRRPVPYERRLASALPYPPAPPGVWRLERHGPYVYGLRNTTARTLTGVRISRTHLPASARGVPEDSVVRPGEAVEFVMAPEGRQPVPDAVAVSWDGQPGPASVPVPNC